MREKVSDFVSESIEQLSDFSLCISDASKNINEECMKLHQEISILETVNDQILKTIERQILEQIPKIQKTTNKSMQKYITNEMEGFSKDLILKIEKLTVIYEKYLKEYNRKFRFNGMVICLTFCISSMISSFSIWHFFPQHQTTIVEFTKAQQEAMEYGKLLKFSLPKLSLKEREKILHVMGSSWNEYYKDLVREDN